MKKVAQAKSDASGLEQTREQVPEAHREQGPAPYADRGSPSLMGTFRYRIELGATPEGPFEALEALVDAGATYTLVPASVLERLGVERTDKQTFVIADGNRIERDVGQAVIRLDGRSRASVVIFGDEGTDALLGAVTLEEFGLGVDPVGKGLMPVPGYLVGFGLSS